MKQRTLLLLLALVLLVLLIVAVSLPKQQHTAPDQATTQTTAPVVREGKLVGICLPSQEEAWTDAGYLLKSQLEGKGYQVELACGDGTAEGQANLLKTLINQGADCLVTAPVDSAALTAAEEAAREKGIPVLAYGSLLMDTDAVSGYICYDYYEMGASIARYIEEDFGLSTAEAEGLHYTIELFMGAPRDYNAVLLHKGLLSVLETYFTGGVLVSKSGRVAFEDSCIAGWSGDAATQACANRLQGSYEGGVPDILICASDSIAGGVIAALETAGVQQEDWPVITGNGATQTGIENLQNGRQALTVRTDAADPAAACAAMVDMALFGRQPDFTLDAVFNNVVSVPTALCGFKLVH